MLHHTTTSLIIFPLKSFIPLVLDYIYIYIYMMPPSLILTPILLNRHVSFHYDPNKLSEDPV